jgi:hypothetical protein
MRNRLAPAIAALVLALGASAARGQGVVAGTQYTLFWRGDLRIIATRPATRIDLVDISTGAPLALPYTSNIAGNPFTLPNAGDSFEANDVASTYRIRIIASTASGPVEDKPVIVWTGALDPTIKHPANPTTGLNAWMSIVPALAPGSVENGSEIGRELWGFTSKEMLIFAKRGPLPTRIDIQDVVTNVESDSDDTQVLTPASPARRYQDGEMEIYYLDRFEDDTFHVTANTDISLWVGVGSASNDWTVTPPSWGQGEDARELGTLFYALGSRDLTIFPTVDDTHVTITDLSDGDDSTTLTLREGDLVGDYDIFLTDTFARNGTGVTPRAANPAVHLNLLGPSAPFEGDFVKIEADRPVLVYVGPKAADSNEYADFAYTVQTGPTSYLLYCFAQNGGAQDLQLFADDPTTRVTITSLTATTGFGAGMGHDFSLPSPTPYLGGNPITNDWYWANGTWNGELLRIQAEGGPISVIDGDYDGPNFGCFIPFVASSGLLLPIADAGPDLSACPGATSVTLDGTRSFDADTTPGADAPTWTWDTNPAIDADSDGNSTNDADLTGDVVSFDLVGPGPWTITLAYVDDDGQRDTDLLLVSRSDTQPPIVDCPASLVADADATGTAFVVVTATVTDNCPAGLVVTNDRTPDGDDASDAYPCGDTTVTFTGTDGSGNRTSCVTLVTVRDFVAPQLDCPARVDAVADATGVALVPVIATASDPCGAVIVGNDRTPGGANATASYPCGATQVTFTATDVGGNFANCVTRVVVSDATPPRIDCPALLTAVPDASGNAAVVVLATGVTDACDAGVPVTNDRTAGGLDATDTYPCGATIVTFTGADDTGNIGSCATTVLVQPATPPIAIGAALRVSKASGLDPHATAHLDWTLAPPPQQWEHYEARRTSTPALRPYPSVLTDPTFVAHDWIDLAASGPLWFYQVHVTDCAGNAAPDPLALSP